MSFSLRQLATKVISIKHINTLMIFLPNYAISNIPIIRVKVNYFVKLNKVEMSKKYLHKLSYLL